MTSTRTLYTTESRGTPYTYPFNGRAAIKNIESAAISRITVRHSSCLGSLTIYYNGEGSGTKYGGSGGNVDEVVLPPGEFITAIEGHTQANGNCISRLIFITNNGKRWGPYGSIAGGQSFNLNGRTLVEADMADQMGLLYLSGSNGTSWIRQLQATFTRYAVPVIPPNVVRYEQVAQGTQSCALAGFSKFAQTLMSPIVTLYVGPNKIVFRTYEDTLCCLPFFRAALTGEFKEASEKKVTMPEDEPEVVSALIQFLYDGTYTYPFKTTKTAAKVSAAPPMELEEGLFHARVYALAYKYDCQGLVDVAKKCLKYVLKGLKGIDIIRLLRETYDKGWAVPQWEEDSDMKVFRQRLPALLKQLFKSNRQEMELIISECPAVGYDIMRLLVSA